MYFKNIIISLTISVVFGGVFVAAQSTPVARCFQFTWLGPRFNNESIFLNATCQEATRLSSGVPCMHPLVASYDGTWPDVTYIWANHAAQATCALTKNDVCAQYTYYFDGHVDNSTYMCTRAVDSYGIAVTSGCYEQRNGGSATRVCFCQSVPGGIPCNSARTLTLNSFVTSALAILVLLRKYIIIYA